MAAAWRRRRVYRCILSSEISANSRHAQNKPTLIKSTHIFVCKKRAKETAQRLLVELRLRGEAVAERVDVSERLIVAGPIVFEPIWRVQKQIVERKLLAERAEALLRRTALAVGRYERQRNHRVSLARQVVAVLAQKIGPSL